MTAVTPVTEGLPSCISWDNAGDSQQEAVACCRQLHSQLLSNDCGANSRARIQEGQYCSCVRPDRSSLHSHKECSPKFMPQHAGHTLPNSAFDQQNFSTSTAAAAAMRKRSAPQPSRNGQSSDQTGAIEPMSASASELASPADPWTEVVHKESGQIYYWNQQTGEQFQLPPKGAHILVFHGTQTSM